MINKVKKICILSSAIIFIVSVFYLIFINCYETAERQLIYSINYLNSNLLGKAEVVVGIINKYDIDTNGCWTLRGDTNFVKSNNFLKMFNLSDEDDLFYYKKMFRSYLDINFSLKKYDLYRAEFALGKGSICEEYPCNIDILVNKENNLFFVSISKI